MRRTVLIVDDHAVSAACTGVLQDDGFEVVGEAADGESAVEAAAVFAAGRPARCAAARDRRVRGRRAPGRRTRSARCGPDLQSAARAPTATGCRTARRAGSSPRRSCRGSACPRCSAEPRSSARRSRPLAVGGWARSWSAARRCPKRPAIWPPGSRCSAAARWRGCGVRAAAAPRLMVLAGAAWFAGDVSSAAAVRPSRAARAPAARLSQRACALARGRAPWSPLAYVDGLVPAIARSDVVTVALMAAIVVAAGRGTEPPPEA